MVGKERCVMEEPRACGDSSLEIIINMMMIMAWMVMIMAIAKDTLYGYHRIGR